MKKIYISLITTALVCASCNMLLLGKKKLTYTESTSYIKSVLSKKYKNDKFYLIPIEKIKECRYYPHILYLGSENDYSFFVLLGKLKYYKDEIGLVALPDSICINKYKTSKDYFYDEEWPAKIVGNRMVVGDK